MQMVRHAASVAIGAAATLLVVSVIVFLAVRLIPGRYEEIVLGPDASPEGRAYLARLYGLDEPLPTQYARWALQAVRGDLGTSLGTGVSVTGEFARRAPVTVELTLLAAAVAVILGFPLGVLAGLAATRRLAGEGSAAITLLLMSVPSFVLGSALVYVFSANDLGLSAGGFVPLDRGIGPNLASIALPAITLGLPYAALLARTARGAVMSVLAEPFVTAAAGRGIPRATIVRRHIIRNAAIPMLTVFGATVGHLLGGAVIIESLFSLPGFGSFTLQALETRDYAVVQAGVLLGTAAFIATSTIVDFAYRVVDPRIRLH